MQQAHKRSTHPPQLQHKPTTSSKLAHKQRQHTPHPHRCQQHSSHQRRSNCNFLLHETSTHGLPITRRSLHDGLGQFLGINCDVHLVLCVGFSCAKCAGLKGFEPHPRSGSKPRKTWPIPKWCLATKAGRAEKWPRLTKSQCRAKKKQSRSRSSRQANSPAASPSPPKQWERHF